MKLDTTPLPTILRAEQAQRWTVGGALAELVDNSFGPGRGNANRVWITHDTRQRTITVLDDGRGLEALVRLFQLGNTIGRAVGDIGVYGAGGTKALLWLARKVEVWTLRDGQVSSDVVDWSHQIRIGEFPQVSDGWRRATVANTPTELLELKHGTCIRIYLANERSFHRSNVVRELAQTYAPAIRMGKRLMWDTVGKGGGSHVLTDPFNEPGEKCVVFDLVVEVSADDVQLPVSGRVCLYPEKPQNQSHVVVAYGPRALIRTRDCYVAPDRSERFTGTGVAGYLDLGEGWQPYLSTTKDSMNDQPVWETLMSHVFERIRPLLEEVANKKLHLELDEIAHQLEYLLDGNVEVQVHGPGGRRAPDPEREVVPRLGSDSDATPSKPPKNPAKAVIAIETMHDHELDGLLCYADVAGDQIGVLINQDHPYVRTAMEEKPVNRKALTHLVVSAVADELADNEVLAKKCFKPRVLRVLDAEKGRNRERRIVRLLMDGAQVA